MLVSQGCNDDAWGQPADAPPPLFEDDDAPPPLFEDEEWGPAVVPPRPQGKRLRLRGKTTPPQPVQLPLLGPLPDFAADEKADGRKRVYLVTFPHPRKAQSQEGRPLVAPETLSRQTLLERFQDCASRPDYVDNKSLMNPTSVKLLDVAVFREFHKENAEGETHAHFHIAVRGGQFRFAPVKRALMRRYGLASHWSCSHDGYWSALRYPSMPSPSKPYASLDPKPVLWSASGEHLPLMECIHEPMTANAIQHRREALERRCAEEGKTAPKITDMDVYAIVVKKGFRNIRDYPFAHLEMIQHVKLHCSTAMQAFVWKHRARLSSLIDDVWRWENVADSVRVAKQSRPEAVLRAAASPCVCRGDWLKAVVGSFLLNGINLSELCADVLRSLCEGRGETTPVVVLAGAQGGEGKSIFLKALFAVFEEEYVFQLPEKGNFPLLNLELGPKVVFLDEWRFVNKIVSFGTQCIWFDGSTVPVARPQNAPGASGHFLYSGSAPIFVTGKLEDLDALQKLSAIDPATGRPASADASMLHRRLKVHSFSQRIQKPPKTRPCAHCFAQLLLNQGPLGGFSL